MSKPLEGKVALVTGATRGLGKGIALQLGDAGATVYITGRTLKSNDSFGSLEQTSNEIKERGGKCIPVQVDHEDDKQIADLFKKIENEQKGRLDILVNNAYKAVKSINQNYSLEFWQMKPEMWDEINNVGLRNHYICSVYAARLMVARKSGLIVNISSGGGGQYFITPLYGIGKEAVDRMAVDCGIELRKHNVCMLSLWVGAVRTELASDIIGKLNDDQKCMRVGVAEMDAKTVKKVLQLGESIEFSGKCIVALAQDQNIMKYASKVVIAEDYAQQKGIKDIDNRVVASFRQVNGMLAIVLPKPLQFITWFIPNFIKIPKFLIDLYTTKF